jgi:hypothetical protein
MIDRATLTRLHMLLAAFIFPAILMFLVTGGFYTWGIKGSYQDSVHDVSLDEPLSADAAKLQALVEAELRRLAIAPPSGAAKVKKGGTSYTLEWTGASRDVVLEPTADPAVARLTVKDTTWYRKLVQLHKAKGGQVFKVYAALLATSLLLILCTGYIIALQSPRLRKSALAASMVGVVTFVLVVAAS